MDEGAPFAGVAASSRAARQLRPSTTSVSSHAVSTYRPRKGLRKMGAVSRVSACRVVSGVVSHRLAAYHVHTMPPYPPLTLPLCDRVHHPVGDMIQ
jgi:hypothetical protein